MEGKEQTRQTVSLPGLLILNLIPTKQCCRKEALMIKNNDTMTELSKADCDALFPHFPIEDRKKYFWGFTYFSRQEYSEAVQLDAADEIMLGIQCIEGGCLCELAIRWYWLNGNTVPQLEVFRESWPLFRTPTFTAVMAQLIKRKADLTPDEVSILLTAHGFTDQSDRPLGANNG